MKDINNYKPMVNVSWIAEKLKKGITSTKDLIKRFNIDYIYVGKDMMVNDKIAQNFVDGYLNKKLTI